MSKRILYLHVGWSKTGTSAIQNALHSNRGMLLDKGILYPESIQWNDNSHHNFALSFRPNSGYSSGMSEEEVINLVSKEFESSPAESMLISSELSPFYYNHKVFNQFVETYFDEVKVIFTVRQQSEFLLSLYNQLLKDPNVRYKGSLFSLAMNNIENMRYIVVVNKWAEVVGQKNIHVVPYSPQVVQQFFLFFGIEYIPSQNQKVINSSFPNYLLLAVKQKNRLINCEAQYKKNLDEILHMADAVENLTPESVIFSIPEQRSIDQYFMEANKRLAHKYLDLSELFKEKQYKPIKSIGFSELKQLYAGVVNGQNS